MGIVIQILLMQVQQKERGFRARGLSSQSSQLILLPKHFTPCTMLGNNYVSSELKWKEIYFPSKLKQNNSTAQYILQTQAHFRAPYFRVPCSRLCPARNPPHWARHPCGPRICPLSSSFQTSP